MMKPAEAVGAVPQEGFRPAPAPRAVAATAPEAAAPLSPEEIEGFRSDPEIIEAVSMFLGRPVTLEEVPEELLIQIAGMVEKLGVQGAVQMAQQNMPPDLQAQLRAAV